MCSGKLVTLQFHLKRNRARQTEDAIAAVIEQLESRMMLTALPDLSSLGSGLPVGFDYGAPPAERPAGYYQSDNPGFYWPAGMNVFAPPVASSTSALTMISAGAITAQAGQSMTITGSDFSGSNVNILAYGQTSATDGTLVSAQIQDATNTGAMIALSTTLPSNSLYLIWPEDSSGIGSPIAVNQTDAQWMSLTPTTGSNDNDNTLVVNYSTYTVVGTTTGYLPTSTTINATYGQSVTVYGQNLTNGAEGMESWVFLDSTTNSYTGYWVPVSSANPYSIQFSVPAGSP
jgi:hypothetical protein